MGHNIIKPVKTYDTLLTNEGSQHFPENLCCDCLLMRGHNITILSQKYHQNKHLPGSLFNVIV